MEGRLVSHAESWYWRRGGAPMEWLVIVVGALGFAFWRIRTFRPKVGSFAAMVVGLRRRSSESEIAEPGGRSASLVPSADNTAKIAPRPHKPADVFVSYKRTERSSVEAIARALRELRFDVWFDAKLLSGSSFDDEINREVRAAKAILVCWSKAAISSEWVRAEATIGRQRGVLAACILEECEPYPPFNLVHAEDLRTVVFDGSNPSWVRLVDQLGNLAGRRGLGAYLTLSSDRREMASWIADNPTDPLVQVVIQRLQQDAGPRNERDAQY